MLACRMAPPRKHRKPKRPTPFGLLLLDAMKARGLSQRQFSALVSERQSIVSRVIYGERRPNPDGLASWAKALELGEQQAEVFIREGRTARLLGKSDSSDHASEILDALRASIVIATDLVAILEDEGLQVPKDLKEGLGILSSRWR